MRPGFVSSCIGPILMGIASILGPANVGRAQSPSVNIDSQLMITDLRVVEDPLRTDSRRNARAPWSFGYLMTQLAGPQDPSDFVMRWLQTWETEQVINTSRAAPRPRIRELIINPWLAASGGRRLDLTKSPFKLLAIVNRIDLRNHDNPTVTTAGEGRFVFGLVKQDRTPVPPIVAESVNPGGFLVIMEFELCATNMAQLGLWTQRWADLGRYTVGSPQYNAYLEQVTRAFTDRGRAPHKPNGSPLNQLRSNELVLAEPWELREFTIQGGHLRPHGMAQTPDIIALNGTPALANLVNANQSALLNGTFVVPQSMLAASSVAGPFLTRHFQDWSSRSFTAHLIEGTDLHDIPWSAEGIVSNDARQALSLNTCDGCHRTETAINFVHIGFPVGHSLPKSLGRPAALSTFLVGRSLPDPVAPATQRVFGDLERRREDLEDLIASFSLARGGAGPTGRHAPTFVH